MSQKRENLNRIISALMDFLHGDILLNKLSNSPLEGNICFDCTLWNKGSIYCATDSEQEIKIQPIKKHFLKLLNSIEHFLRCELSDSNNKNYDYKSQVDRFLCILLDLKNKISSIICFNTCSDTNIISLLLTTTIQTILNLVNVLENINTLLFISYDDSNCICIHANTFSIFMGLFINSITQLQSLLHDWYIIAVTFFNLSSCTPKPYVASYIPKTCFTTPKFSNSISHFCPPCTPNNVDCNNKNNFRHN